MIEAIPFDGKVQAEKILKKCRRTLKMWKGVYNSLGQEFEWREPTADEMLLALQLEAEKLNKQIQRKHK